MDFELAKNIVDQAGSEMLGNPNNGWIGTSVGRKNQGPITGRGDFCVTVYVVKKWSSRNPMTPSAETAYEVVKQEAFRLFYVNIVPKDVDVVEVGDEFRAQSYTGSDHANPPAANTQKWFLSLGPGIGIANPVGTYPQTLDGGTIAFFLKDDNKNNYLVSCNHVIGGARGDDGSPVPADVVVQPATSDLNGRDISTLPTTADIDREFGIADLVAFVPMSFVTPGAAPSPTNIVDAAMAALRSLPTRKVDSLSRIPYCGKILGVAAPYEWDTVENAVKGSPHIYKVGRTTAFSSGTVTGVNGKTTVVFPTGTASFTNQLIIRRSADNTGPFSLQGDSGSPVITEEHKIAGMIFAGGPSRSLANPFDVVLSELARVSGLGLSLVI